jgi:hypothetical protein
VIAVVREHSRLLGYAFLGAGGYYALTDAQIPEVSGATAIIALVIVLAAGGAHLLAKRLYDLLHREEWIYLVDVEVPNERFEIHRLNPEKFSQLTVEEGSLRSLPNTMFRAYECKRYQPKANQCWGTWRGSASDLELVAEHERIREIRGELEDMARDGHKIRVKAPSVIRSAVADIVMEVVAIAEGSRVPSGELIGEAFESAVEGFEFESDVATVDPDQEVAGELPAGTPDGEIDVEALEAGADRPAADGVEVADE